MCISSQDGAGGHEAARLVASSLGFRLIDEDIVARAAIEAGVDKDVVAGVEQRKSALVRLIEGLGSGLMVAGAGYVGAPAEIVVNDQPASDELRGLIRSVIEDIATDGSAVIVAHAASLALADRDDVLRVHVTASPQTRARRLAATRELDQDEAARTVKRSDAGRADYLKRFYGVSAEQPTHYDLVINTDKVAPEAAATLIVQAAGTSAIA